jgi:hypothetical protein
MSKMSRRIVVDASVANSAGNGTHPTSRMCREFLLDMMTICHKTVVSGEILVEWRNHASAFSVTWLAAMRAKRKIVTINPRLEGSLVVRIENASDFTPQQVAAMEKDLLLIAAALETDNLIASCDSKAKGLFAQAAAQVDDIKNIIWVNPNDESDHCSDWLKSGARYVPERSLGVSVDIQNG